MLDCVIIPRARDLGDGFTVRRALPAAERRMVGPFVFWDQMGPTVIAPGRGLDVRPHPHIGLATVTYLFEGEIVHRDSLGIVQAIEPGAVNLMTAGRGIVHSERTSTDLRATGGPLFGIQSWLALPKDLEECAPAFKHLAAESLPEWRDDGAKIRLVMGQLAGQRSPVPLASDTLYADVTLQPGGRFVLPAGIEEAAFYVVNGSVMLDHRACQAGELLILTAGAEAMVTAEVPARLMVLGGASMDGPRHVWWNFVSSSRERIEQAKEDWRGGRFPAVPGETEFIPLPEDPRPQAVRYP